MLQTAPKHATEQSGSGEIRLVNLTKTFGNLQAVKSIVVTVPHGSY